MSADGDIAAQYAFLDQVHLRPDRPKAAQVYDALRRAIVDLELEPGSSLKKEVVCEKLKVSKTPVSEAIARLEENGLVDVYPQHGTFVTRIRESDVRQGAFLRRALEVAAVREVAARATPDQVELLRKNLRYQQTALAAGDLEDFHASDERFHTLICEFTGYPRLPRMVDSARGQLDRVRKMLLPYASRPAETVGEHTAILRAIADRDADAAAQATKEHLDKTPNKLEQLIQQRPDLFET